MADSKKTATLKRVMAEGHTGSYGTLLHLTAVMGSDPEKLEPESIRERIEWCGHFKGLKAALLCLAMYERKLDPNSAARIVNQHIREAMKDLEQGDGTGTGE
ncbi:MAG: hypothetical protein AUG49_22680 [Catenulispora sp. 13_1_20CM_3_70_7]|nr:MAG: hypothetical protein AUG49_22680 [Catenulispora sp. 13_1_20CM_3_70_7]